MKTEDYFRMGGAAQGVMRGLLEREATLRAPRFGLQRRAFLAGAMGALAASSILSQVRSFGSVAQAQESFSPPSDDCYAEVEATHASFGQSDASTALDWQIIQGSVRAQQAAVPQTVMNMLFANRTIYAGFPISRLEHTLQTATRALRAGASDELVLIALLHDAAEVLSGVNHAEVAAALVRPYVSEASYYLVRTHMEFQLKHYGEHVGMPTDLRDRYRNEAWYGDAVVFSDAWDEISFDPGYRSLPLAEFEPLVRQFFSRVPPHELRTARDCL